VRLLLLLLLPLPLNEEVEAHRDVGEGGWLHHDLHGTKEPNCSNNHSVLVKRNDTDRPIHPSHNPQPHTQIIKSESSASLLKN
jgi:hypothetical protein